MDITRFITKNQRRVLSKARETYGDTAQILVSNEELCELAAVCAKFPRYKDKKTAQKELHQKAVDEVADVLIILDHMINIFELTPVEIGERVAGKIARLNNWLNTSNSMEQTTKDRAVPEATQMSLFESSPINCGRCKHMGNFNNLKPGGRCLSCVENEGNLFEPSEED